jgi:hypothetical protein
MNIILMKLIPKNIIDFASQYLSSSSPRLPEQVNNQPQAVKCYSC